MSDNDVNKPSPLRFRYDAAYEKLMDVIRTAGLNAYDVIAEAVDDEPPKKAVLIRIRYGDGFRQTKEQSFDESCLRVPCAEMIEFFQQVAKDCNQTNITEYRAYMKNPRP
ncbi:hypothetical protein [Alicyclobacillus ferrooxydans]|uniref:Uncharacterized protein n=1 Tax=Alicyclobacillus ferrooxydans TaxID=471514 RepID=A0A0N8PPX9_9BACL|nr:hypothetical protein [Alicyclobacillus ferrooxydans]KPV45573.1 hypothetical protein AN477_01190 [Alicyclobacillus ferrooxydans]